MILREFPAKLCDSISGLLEPLLNSAFSESHRSLPLSFNGVIIASANFALIAPVASSRQI